MAKHNFAAKSIDGDRTDTDTIIVRVITAQSQHLTFTELSR